MVRKKFIFALVCLLFGFTTGFLIAEAALRWKTPDWLSIRMKEAGLGNAEGFGSDVGWAIETTHGHFVRFQPNTSFRMKYYEYNTTAHIGQWGARIVESERDERKNRLVPVPFMGDSFAFGIGVDDNQTYVNLIDRKSKLPYLNL